MAGFFDGEGYPAIRRIRPRHQYNPCLLPGVPISNTFRPVLEFFLTEYGGCIYSNGNEKHEGWAPGFFWNCPVSSIRRFLEDVQPYLKVKHQQAAILLEFMKLLRGPPGYGKRLSPTELAERERLWWELHQLKTKAKKLGHFNKNFKEALVAIA